MEKKKQIMTKFCIVLLISSILGFSLFFCRKLYGTITESNRFKQGEWQEGDVHYNGKTYRYNDSVKTYLFMGIDNEGTIESAAGGLSGGQSDAMFLLVADDRQEKLSVISINRNAMVMVDVYDLLDNCIRQEKKQICLQYAYGDGGRTSCTRAASTVSRLFYDIPIDGYFALNMSAIPILNDAIGGVTVEVMEDLYNEGMGVDLKVGETVHLNGREAYAYILFRNTEEFDSASKRLERQKQYLKQLYEKIQNSTLSSVASILKIYDEIERFFVSDIDFVKLAEEVYHYTFTEESMYSVPGITTMGETYEEYDIDETGLYELILDVFYIEL